MNHISHQNEISRSGHQRTPKEKEKSRSRASMRKALPGKLPKAVFQNCHSQNPFDNVAHHRDGVAKISLCRIDISPIFVKLSANS